MSEVKRCAACGKENPVSEMNVCMHQQMHRYVCDSKCMTDFYNQPKKPTAAELEAKVAALEAENAKLRAELERRESDGWKLVPVEPTEEMLRAGVDAAIAQKNSRPWCPPCYRAMLAAAPSAPKADDPVKVKLLEVLEKIMAAPRRWYGLIVVNEEDEVQARAAIAAARKGEGE